MKKIILLFSLLSFLWYGCGNESTKTEGEDYLTDHPVKQNKKSKSNSPKKASYWVFMKNQLDINDNQIKKLKIIDSNRKKELENTNSPAQVHEKYKQQEVTIIGEDLFRKKQVLHAYYQNPLSQFNLTRRINLTQAEKNKIEEIKNKYQEKINSLKSNPSFSQSELEKIHSQKEKEILATLPKGKVRGYNEIKANNNSDKWWIPFQ